MLTLYQSLSKLLVSKQGEINMNNSLMENEFHDWLEQCPNNWVRLAADDDSSTYKFYREDQEED